ncbi:MAG: aspartate carbamoyltransferase [Anaerolineae bacterium]
MKPVEMRNPKTVAIVGLVALVAAVIAVVTLTLVSHYRAAAVQARQAEIEARGADVMPFDQNQTQHIFTPTDDGGLQQVVAKDPSNQQQIALIQAHLSEEADRFKRGDFADPASIHGQDMAGLSELETGAASIDIQYAPLPNGAEIRYTAKDPQLVMALHHWFMAQLADHGAHASMHP